MIYCDRLKLNLMTEAFQRTSRFSLGMVIAYTGYATVQSRARDQGVRFNGTPGRLNVISDVAGAEAGQITLISGGGRRKVVTGPVRTGVTIILPRNTDNNEPVYGDYFNLNGNYEMTGQSCIRASATRTRSVRSTPVSNDARKPVLASRPLGGRD